MISIEIDLDGIIAVVHLYNDGEPHSIKSLCGKDIEHHLTNSCAGLFYSKAWEAHRDPNNEADFRREEFL